jgi:hypothetical protein
LQYLRRRRLLFQRLFQFASESADLSLQVGSGYASGRRFASVTVLWRRPLAGWPPALPGRLMSPPWAVTTMLDFT